MLFVNLKRLSFELSFAKSTSSSIKSVKTGFNLLLPFPHLFRKECENVGEMLKFTEWLVHYMKMILWNRKKIFFSVMFLLWKCPNYHYLWKLSLSVLSSIFFYTFKSKVLAKLKMWNIANTVCFYDLNNIKGRQYHNSLNLEDL